MKMDLSFYNVVLVLQNVGQSQNNKKYSSLGLFLVNVERLVQVVTVLSFITHVQLTEE